MARTWGPVEKPEGHHDDESGTVEQPNEHGSASGRNENYNATDGRHNKADHQGWPSVDGNSGEDVDESGHATRRFPDGPGKWRQT